MWYKRIQPTEINAILILNDSFIFQEWLSKIMAYFSADRPALDLRLFTRIFNLGKINSSIYIFTFTSVSNSIVERNQKEFLHFLHSTGITLPVP